MLVGAYDLKCPRCGADDVSVERKRRRLLDAAGNVITGQRELPPGSSFGLATIREGDVIGRNTTIHTFYTCNPCRLLIAKVDSRKPWVSVYDPNKRRGNFTRYDMESGTKIVLRLPFMPSPLSLDKQKVLDQIKRMLAYSQDKTFITTLLVQQYQTDERTARGYIQMAVLQTLQNRAARRHRTPATQKQDDLAAACELYDGVIRQCGEILSKGPSEVAMRMMMQARAELSKLQGLYAEHYSKVAEAANAGKTIQNNVHIYLPHSPRSRDPIPAGARRLNIVPEQQAISLPALTNPNGTQEQPSP